MPTSGDIPHPVDLNIPLGQTTEATIGKGLAHLVASLGPNKLQHSYTIDAGAGIEAMLEMREGSSKLSGDEQLVPDAVIIIIGDSKKNRTIRASVDTEESDLLRGYQEYPKSLVVREITDKRSAVLNDGTRVTDSTIIGRRIYPSSKTDGEPTFQPGVLDVRTTIIKRLKTAPVHKGQPFTIFVAWGGYKEDGYEVQPNAMRYEKHGKDEWSKTYVYIDDKGKVERPIGEEVFVGKNEPPLKVEFAPVLPDELNDIQGILTTAGNFGSPDTSLLQLIDTEITPDQDTLDRLTKEYNNLQTERLKRHQREEEETGWEYVGTGGPGEE